VCFLMERSSQEVHFEQQKKAALVDLFIKQRNHLMRKLESDLKRSRKVKYLALFTMMRTMMRVGNIEYFIHLGHKGLTTLQKKDIHVSGNVVTFDFIGKDGVPQHIEEKFEGYYIEALRSIMLRKKSDDFVFADKDGHPIHSAALSEILFNYTKQHFYPHIIRSYYADFQIWNFLKNHKKASKDEVEKKFMKVAEKLGHKKYNKKKDIWEVNFKVTISNYIRPDYVEKMIKLYS